MLKPGQFSLADSELKAVSWYWQGALHWAWVGRWSQCAPTQLWGHRLFG